MSLERPSINHVGSIVVFSDDWGRHPSSCQHLVRNLLDRYPVLWVNTIGTRAPRLDLQTVKRVGEKLRQWSIARILKRNQSASGSASGQCPSVAHTHPHLNVVNPKMWPWFASDRDRRLNRWLLSKQLAPLIEQLPKPVVALTTLPITADLPKSLPVSRWVYYCVDDFSQWPGLDGDTLRKMDRDMIQRADSLIAVSENLQDMIANDGRSSSLLTHGVDVDFWNTQRRLSTRSDTLMRRSDGNRMMLNAATKSEGQGRVSLAVLNHSDNLVSSGAAELPRTSWKSDSSRESAYPPCDLLKDFPSPLIVFWGVVDRRMDSPSIRQLSCDLIEGTIVLIGPQQDPDPSLLSLSNVRTLPAQPLTALPAIADRADVLIMPYADLPVTRAMQPLKLKEYLATGKSVVVNRLPSTDAWCDCLDVAESPGEFSQLVRHRIYSGIPVSQMMARCRLQQESWKTKAERLEHILKSESQSATLQDGRPQLLSCLPSAPLRCS